MPLRGETVGTAYVRILADGDGMPESIKKEMKDQEPVFEKGGQDAKKAFDRGVYQQQQRDGNAFLSPKFFKDLNKFVGEMRIGGKKGATQFSKSFTENLELNFKKVQVGASFSNLAAFNKNLERDLKRTGPEIDGFNDRLFRMAGTLGTAFGKGSRNNFLNFFGSLIGNIASLAPRLVNLGQSIAGLSKGGAAGGAALRGLASGGAALIVIIPVLIGVLGILISTMTLLLGIVIALAASISFALVAAVAALIGTMAPLVVAIGVVTAGFLSLDKAGKKALKESLKPLADGLKELGDIAADRLFKNLGDDLKPLEGTFDRLGGENGLVAGVADAVRDIVKQFVILSNSKQAQKITKIFEDNLPAAIELLGNIFNKTFVGILNTFAILVDGEDSLVMRFLTAVSDLADRFAAFTGSAEGQNKLEKFFDDAADSAESVIDFLDSIGALIGTLFGAGRDTGDNIFTDMANAIDNFNDKLKENPQDLQDFFDRTKEFADDLGVIFKNVASIIGFFASPEFQTASITLLQIADTLLTIQVAISSPIFKTFAALFVSGTLVVSAAFTTMAIIILESLGGVLTAAAAAFGWIPGIGPKLKNASANFNTFKDDTIAKLLGVDKALLKTIGQITGIGSEAKKQKGFVDTLFGAIDRAIVKAQGLEDLTDLLDGTPRVGNPYTTDPTTKGPVRPGQDGRNSGTGSTPKVSSLYRSVNIDNVTVITPSADPVTVAEETVNRIAASAMF